MVDPARITQQYVEVAVDEDSEPRSARITQQYVEAAISEDAEPRSARISQQYIEVAAEVTDSLDTLEATEVASVSVILNGIVYSNKSPYPFDPALDCNVSFDYSLSSDFSTFESTAIQSLGAAGSFSIEIPSGLTFAETYYFRAVLNNGTTTYYGDTLSFIASDYYEDQELDTGTLEGVEVVADVLQLVHDGSVYATTGNRITPEIDISSAGSYNSSKVNWTSTEPEGTSLVIESKVSSNGGVSWGQWRQLYKDGEIPELESMSDFSQALVQFKQSFETTDDSKTAVLEDFIFFVKNRNRTITQYAYRFRNDDGNEANATWKGNENSSVGLEPENPIRIRFGLDAVGLIGAKYFQLEYRVKKSTEEDFGFWKELTP